jgi:CIC family chloride channel protein
VIGLVLVVSPAIMGVGYDYVDQALNGGLVLKTMALLCALKLAATVVSYASGNAGGIFAPSLYIGAMAGGAVGLIVRNIAPFPTAEPGAYALVGMGTLFAGIIRAPMTSVFMIFEITQDYQILVPLMVANMLSFIISRRYQPVPVYHSLLQQDGIHLPSPSTHAGSRSRTAGHVMQTDLAMLSPELTIEQAWRLFGADASPRYLVGADRHLVGVVDFEDLDKALATGNGAKSLWSIVDHDFVHAHPDQTIDIVLDRLAQSGGILPVVSRTDARHLEGVITIDGLLKRTESSVAGQPVVSDGNLH